MDSCLVFSFFIFTLNFSEVETASEMTKTMLDWVFYLLTLVNVMLVKMWNWPEHAVSESKNIGLYKRGFREHCSLPHCYRKRSFLGPEFTKIAFGGRAPPGPAGGAYSAPQTS